MAKAKSELPIIADNTAAYVIRDQQLFEAIVAITRHALDRYDDAAILDTQQHRLVLAVRDEVRSELQQHSPDWFDTTEPQQLDRALEAYITKEVRKRQSWAFEQQLAQEFGPLDLFDAQGIADRISTVNGVSVVATDPQSQSDTVKSA